MLADPISMLVLLPLALLLAAGLVRLRGRVTYGLGDRAVEARFGALGLELDLAAGRAAVRLFGWSAFTFGLRGESAREANGQAATEQPETAQPEPDEPATPRASGRERPLADLLLALRGSADGVLCFVGGLFATVAREQLEARVVLALEEPHLIGMAMGYYFAAAGLVPGVAERLALVPDWVSQERGVAVEVAAAVPIYRVGGLLALLFWRLPWRRWLRVITGRKKV